MERVREPLVVVGDEGEFVVAAVRAFAELLHVRRVARIRFHLEHAIQTMRAVREVFRRKVDELDRVDRLRIDLALRILLHRIGGGAGEPRLFFLEQHEVRRVLGHRQRVAIEMDVLFGISRVAELRQEIDQVLNALARSGQRDFVVLVGDPEVEPRLLRQFDSPLERLARDRGKAQPLCGSEQEVTAMRIFDQMLTRILDRRLVGALAPEVVAEIERPDDLVEKLRVTFRRFGHSNVRTGTNLPYLPAPALFAPAPSPSPHPLPRPGWGGERSDQTRSRRCAPPPRARERERARAREREARVAGVKRTGPERRTQNAERRVQNLEALPTSIAERCALSHGGRVSQFCFCALRSAFLGRARRARNKRTCVTSRRAGSSLSPRYGSVRASLFPYRRGSSTNHPCALPRRRGSTRESVAS